MTLMLYGIVEDDHPLWRERNERPELRVIPSDGLAVIGREVEHEPGEQDAEDYLDVLVELMRDGPVVPLRFGTTAPDTDAVADEVIRPSSARHSALLDAVREYGEIRMDIAYDHEAVLRAILTEDPSLAARGEHLDGEGADLEAKVAFGQEVAERFRVYCGDHASQVFARTGDFAEQSVRLIPPREGVERIALLMRLDRVERLDAFTAGVREELAGLAEVATIGPLPVFSFLERFEAAAASAESSTESRWGW